jgi:hypothetical protein
MNAPRAGWHPDPTERHDYRYWDGVQWTDDVSDGGVTAVDPVPDEPGGGMAGGGPGGGFPGAGGAGAAATGGFEAARGADPGFGQGPLVEQPSYYSGGTGGRRALGPGTAAPAGSNGATRAFDDLALRPGGFGDPDRYTGGHARYQGADEPTQHAGGFGATQGYESGPGFGDQSTHYAGGWSDDDRYAYRDPAYRSDGSLPGVSDRSGPSKTLMVGVGLVAVALIAGLAVLLTAGQGEGGGTEGTEISEDRDQADGSEGRPGGPETSDTTTTTAAPGTGSTAPGAPGGSTTTTGAPPATPPPGGGGGGGGGAEEATVDQIAQELHSRSQGGLTEDQAQCMSQGMVDALGPEMAAEMAAGGQPDPSQVSQEEMMALQQAVLGCGVSPGGGGGG